jgi:hypothetical protein
VERYVTVCNDSAPDSEVWCTWMIYTRQWIVKVLIIFGNSNITTTTITTTTATATTTTTTMTTIIISIIIIIIITSRTIIMQTLIFCTFVKKNSYRLLIFVMSVRLSVCLNVRTGAPLNGFPLNFILALFTNCFHKFCLKFEINSGKISMKFPQTSACVPVGISSLMGVYRDNGRQDEEVVVGYSRYYPRIW